MSNRKSYAIFGLGRYGRAVALELTAGGAEVLAVDHNESTVNALAPDIPLCKCADVTDPDVLRQLDIASFDTVIVAMAESLESSVMAVMLCKEMGVKNVIVKCGSDIHRKILSRVGADQVVFPESESGVRLAKNLLSAGFVDLLELAKDVSMVEINVRPEWVGKCLMELHLRRKYGINVVAIRHGEDLQINVDPEKALAKDTRLLVIANPARLGKLK
jgi:trk system potassium uptake protein TrkA